MTQSKQPELGPTLARAFQALRSMPDQIKQLAQLFAEADQELALVGGPVRDAFLGKPPHDFDLTTSAHPDQVIAIIKPWADALWEIGRDYGTIGAARQGITVEITTYRNEVYDMGSRKPEVTYGHSLEGDLARRDFTVNAMALRLPSFELVDPFDGLSAINAGILTTPVSAEQSFDDDPLRIMRAARFAAQLGFAVEEEVLRAMGTMAPRLQIVSIERIQAEFQRLMISPEPRRGLELMVYTGVAQEVLPELMELVETADEHNRHKDIYEHTLTVLDQAIALETDETGPVPGPDLVLRLAALLHDIGKPATRKFEPDGTVSFYHHDVVGAKITRKRLRAMRFDKQTITDVTRLVELHQRFHGYGEQKWTDSAVRRYVTDAGPLLERLHRLTKADCTTRNQRKAHRLAAAYADLEQRIAQLQEKEELAAVRPDLDGSEIMQILGISPGRDVGRAYAFLLEHRLEHGPIDKDVAKALLIKWWEENQTQI